jgi:hypothetical protein
MIGKWNGLLLLWLLLIDTDQRDLQPGLIDSILDKSVHCVDVLVEESMVWMLRRGLGFK